MVVDKAFYKPTDGGFLRSISFRKAKSITRKSIYSSENKVLFSPQRKWSKVVNLLPGYWMVTLGNGIISGTH